MATGKRHAPNRPPCTQISRVVWRLSR
jgi:hypothetical protein